MADNGVSRYGVFMSAVVRSRIIDTLQVNIGVYYYLNLNPIPNPTLTHSNTNPFLNRNPNLSPSLTLIEV